MIMRWHEIGKILTIRQDCWVSRRAESDYLHKPIKKGVNVFAVARNPHVTVVIMADGFVGWTSNTCFDAFTSTSY